MLPFFRVEGLLKEMPPSDPHQDLDALKELVGDLDLTPRRLAAGALLSGLSQEEEEKETQENKIFKDRYISGKTLKIVLSTEMEEPKW